MRAALYLRMSTDHQDDSIATQRENATRWCTTKNHAVVGEFRDEGRSRTDFSRPGLAQLLEAAQRSEIDLVVIRELARLGGEIFQGGALVRTLNLAGVRVFQYADGQEIAANNANEALMTAVRLHGAQDYVEKVRTNTREAFVTRARAGKVTGKLPYGYRGRPAPTLNRHGRPTHVDPVIDAERQATVLDIFERYARGEGLNTIARALNEQGVAGPRNRAWAASSIREMLRNEIYVGVLVRGVWRNLPGVRGPRTGNKARVRADPSAVIRVDAPALRIVAPELWAAARARMGSHADGRPRAPKTVVGRPPVNLLSHILKCGVCNSSMRVVNTKVSYESEPAYMCTAFHARKHVPFLGGRCTNSLRRPVAEVNGAVLSWLDAELLREQLVRDTIDEVRRRIEARLRERATDATRARQRAAKLRAECARLAELAMGAPPGAESVFYDQIGERKRELDGRDARLRAMAVAPSAVDLELRRLMGEASRRIASMRDVLAHAAPQAARALLTQLFPQGITADPVVIPNPEGKGRREQKRLALSGESTGAWPLLLVAEGPATHALLAAGNAAGGGEVTRSKVASPAGFEPA